jgi:L-cysteate sulfo-lyase
MLLNSLSDAQIKPYPAGASSNACIEHYANELEAMQGIVPYQIPMGGSNAIGSLGYVKAALEIAQQLSELSAPPTKLITASGSAGTQAGLIVGFVLAKCDIQVIGASVLNDKNTLTNHVLSLCEQLAERLQIKDIQWNEKITVVDEFIGEGYGIPNRSTWQAMRIGMELESVILDPCYTAKAFQCLLSLCEQQTQNQSNSGYLFLHTGGVNGLMAYQSQIQDARERGLFD